MIWNNYIELWSGKRIRVDNIENRIFKRYDLRIKSFDPETFKFVKNRIIGVKKMYRRDSYRIRVSNGWIDFVPNIKFFVQKNDGNSVFRHISEIREEYKIYHSNNGLLSPTIILSIFGDRAKTRWFRIKLEKKPYNFLSNGFIVGIENV